MSSTNKTSHLALNNWSSSDRPMRGDFNSDNAIIDTALGEHLESTTLHLSEEEKDRVSRPLAYVGYTGNGDSERTVTVEGTPQAVFVYRVGMPFEVYSSTDACTKVYSAYAQRTAGATAGIVLSAAGLTVKESSAAENGIRLCLNESGAQYRVAVIR
ncbi:MAG: hypothetical protein ACI4GZ_03175 [Ruminococcus sp.]